MNIVNNQKNIQYDIIDQATYVIDGQTNVLTKTNKQTRDINLTN